MKRGDTIKLKTSSTINQGKDFVDYIVKSKNVVNKGRVEKITLVTKGNEGAVKKFLYKRDGKVTFAIGDMGASIDDIKEGTWALPDSPKAKAELKKLMSKPIKLGKEGDDAADKLYALIGDDELFDDLYVAGKKNPNGDARDVVKKHMKRLGIKEEVELDEKFVDKDPQGKKFGWVIFNTKTNELIAKHDDKKTIEKMKQRYERMGEPVTMMTFSKAFQYNEEVELDEMKMDDPKLVKTFDKLKRGDTVKLQTSSTISKGTDFVDYVVKSKNTVNKGRVEKVTLVTKGNEKAVKKFLYKRDGKVTFAIGDMGASIDDIKEGTWALPDSPKAKAELKKLMSKPIKLGKEGDEASDKLYALIGDDELFDDLYVAGKKNPNGDARDVVKKHMKRLGIKEEVELEEGKSSTGYELYHKDFSSAMAHAYDFAKKKFGIEVDPKEIDDKVASGPRKPSKGKTNSYRLKGKDGKKAIQVQVYGMDNGKYELNMYKEGVEPIQWPSQPLEEKLKVSDGLGAWIDDFKKSDAPQFAGKSDEEKKNMAIAAFTDAGGKLDEETELDEKTTKTFGVEFQINAPDEKPIRTGNEPHVKLVNKLVKKYKLFDDHADDLSKFNVKDDVGG